MNRKYECTFIRELNRKGLGTNLSLKEDSFNLEYI